MTALTLTLIGGPTMLIEADGFRLITDPTFDAPGIVRRQDRAGRRGADQS